MHVQQPVRGQQGRERHEESQPARQKDSPAEGGSHERGKIRKHLRSQIDAKDSEKDPKQQEEECKNFRATRAKRRGHGSFH
jgi:hypothetical protein